MPNNLLIREANREEIEIVHAIMIEAFTEYIGVLRPPSGALSETVESLQSKIANNGGAIIAIDDTQAAGATIYYYQENYMYIGRVSVLPTFRGKGIGREMIYYLEQQAMKMGYAETRVEVRLSLLDNLRLYEKLAYRAIQEIEYPEKTDSWYIMSKNLQDCKVK
jgi:ribosomal protein S18 acetylase RimI-like enzyme